MVTVVTNLSNRKVLISNSFFDHSQFVKWVYNLYGQNEGRRAHFSILIDRSNHHVEFHSSVGNMWTDYDTLGN